MMLPADLMRVRAAEESLMNSRHCFDVALKTKLLLVVTSPAIVNDIHGVLKAHAPPART